MELSVIIVTYNTLQFLGPCLSSVLAADPADKEVFVVDNASRDGSADMVERDFPQVRLIRNAENRGFAAANNQALPLCRGRCLLYLNPDTEVRPGALIAGIAYLDTHPAVGLAGARMINPDGTPQESVSLRYPGERHTRGELANLPGRIAAVLGAAMFAPADLIRSLGGFDEGFFLYGEDQDLCLRIRRAGREIGFIDDAVIFHAGGGSEQDSPSADVVRRKVRAEYLFYRKHYRPESVARIRRLQDLQARWRLWTLGLSTLLSPGKEETKRKRDRYRTVLEEIRNHG
ncbi:MAG: glycosyltransferase family 2 protein [Syntrophaceae bacterium]|nr:glycosyltransferase family 2 protein [Syntrophaceae bacterium]